MKAIRQFYCNYIFGEFTSTGIKGKAIQIQKITQKKLIEELRILWLTVSTIVNGSTLHFLYNFLIFTLHLKLHLRHSEYVFTRSMNILAYMYICSI